ncbi:hypothetical protein [Clostridium sp.]|uniref:hypothetical protein n=1 Tax=Clostridium sp. TaxID=1506 RepID=UPI003463BCBA
MKDAQKKILGAILAASSVAGVVAPSVTAFAADNQEEIKTIIEDNLKKLEKDPKFAYYHIVERMSYRLTDKNEAEIVRGKVAKYASVYTKEVKDVLDQMGKLTETKDMTMFNQLRDTVIPAIKDDIDRDYLMGQLAEWETTFVNENEPNYYKVVAALEKVYNLKGEKKYDEALKEAEAAKELVAGLKYEPNKKYLDGEVKAAVEAVNKEHKLMITEAKATNAKAITVKFSKAVDDTSKVTFNVKRDGAPVTFSEVKWNEAKTEATLAVSYKLLTGNYTLEAKVGEEVVKAADFKVEESKIDKIEFLSDKLSLVDMSTTDGQKQVVTFAKVLNQYGEDITAETADTLKVVASKGDAEIGKDGKITISSDQTYMVSEKVSISIIDTKTGVNNNKTLEVIPMLNISSVEIGDIITDEKDKEIYAETDLKEKEYYLPIIVKDEAGNVINDKAIIENNLSINYSSNLLTGKLEMKDNKPVIRLEKEASDKWGTAYITVVSFNGKNTQKEIKIKENSKVDSIKLYANDAIIKPGAEFVVSIDAVDQYGNRLEAAKGALTPDKIFTPATEIKLGKDKVNAQSTIKAENATITAMVDYNKNDKLYFKVKVDGDVVDTDQVAITATTATGKFERLTFNVKKASETKKIVGINKDYASKLNLYQVGYSGDEITGSDFIYEDQYGIQTKEIKNAVAKVEEISDPNNVVTNENGNITADAEGKAQYRTVLYAAEFDEDGVFTNYLDKDGKNVGNEITKAKVIDEYKFEISVVNSDKVVNFKLGDLYNKQNRSLKKLYTGDDNKDNTANTINYSSNYVGKLDLIGMTEAGKSVNITADTFTGAKAAGTGATPTPEVKADLVATQGLEAKIDKSTIYITNGDKIDTENKDKTATVSLTLTAGDKTVKVVSKDLTFNSEDAKVEKISVFNANTSAYVEDPTIVAKIKDGKINYRFRAIDQYGVNQDVKIDAYKEDGTKLDDESIKADGTVNTTNVVGGNKYQLVMKHAGSGLVKRVNLALEK